MDHHYTESSWKIKQIAEAFSGPRTKDVEFDQKVEDMKMVEKSILGFKHLIQNYVSYTSGIKSFCRDFYNSNRIIYDKTTSFGAIGNDVCECHIQVEKAYEELVASVSELNLATTQWTNMFSQAKVLKN